MRKSVVRTNMIRAIVALLIVLGAVPAIAAEQMEAPKDMVVLTVSGEIANANRGPLDPGKDSVLAQQKIDFPRAFAFDRSMLLQLEQGTVIAQPPGFKQPTTFTGPLVNEVLAAVGATSAKVRFRAVNGYEGWLSPEDIGKSDWILALAADGAPLGLGQQGPLWLLKTLAEGEKPSETPEGHWVWAIFYIKVGD
jgi:hypothetical protein